MKQTASIQFFDTQFQHQLRAGDLALNPFELAALPYLRGRVLDFGCGLGNLAIAAAHRGCSVVALDASPAAICHVRKVAANAALSIDAEVADLRNYQLQEDFDTVVSIGLFMFFDCPTALRQLIHLQEHVRPGGLAVVNVLIEGTTYLDMFGPEGHCLFAADELRQRFDGWNVIRLEHQDFAAPAGSVKSFVTLVAQKPAPEIADV